MHLSFAAKKKMADDAPLATVKRAFTRGETFGDVGGALRSRVASRQGAGHPARAAGVSARVLDRDPEAALSLGLAPRSLVDTDPLYASAFVANLGSIQIDAAYHHLYEHGNCPLLVTVGKARGDKLTLRYTFDERVEDGHYCAKSLELFEQHVEDPASWITDR